MNLAATRVFVRALFLSVAACGTNALAGSIEIQFLGLDIAYDAGSDTISDASGSGPDALTSVTIAENGVPIAGSPFSGAISLDLSIPGIPDISATGATVASGSGGMLELGLPGGDSLSLTLGSAVINYSDLGFIQIATGVSAADVASQSLPGGLIIGDPISVTFITTIDSLTDDGTNLLTFAGSSTGQIDGVAVPEPTSAALLGVITLLGGVRRRRSA